MKKYVADFETATWLEDETYVWAWALCNIENVEEIKIGNTIESFLEEIEKENCKIWFHNLAFDGEFILCYLYKLGFKYINDPKEKEDKTFTTLVSDMGLFYSIEIYFKVENKRIKKVTIYDSLKIIPISVEDIPKAFGIPENKLYLDYDRIREEGYSLQDYELAYIRNDVIIVALALKQMFDKDLTKMTIGSNALGSFKKTMNKLKFERLFPSMDYNLFLDLKKSYKGGFTYLNPKYEEVDNGETINLDVNSLYPSVLRYEPMPYGEPIFYEGKYVEDNIYPLYIQRIVCSFEIKKDMIPTIQVKGKRFFLENEYLESSKGEVIALTLTSIDLKLFLDHYEVYDIDYVCGWKFKSMNGMFNEYIDYWIEEKNKATIEGNRGKRQIAKLLLNSLYGRFAINMKGREKIPIYYNERILYELGEEEDRKGLYIPVASFITAYARNKTIRTSQAIKTYSINKYGKDMYIYSDTDSIKTLLPLEELKQFCEIDPVKLGAWKYEGTATRSRFVRQKTYLEEFINEKTGEKEVQITCCGMPKSCYKYVEWEKFKKGFSCGGKLVHKHVKGGVKLVETNFTIKSDILKKNMKNF